MALGAVLSIMVGRGARSDRGNVRGALADEFTHVITRVAMRNRVLKREPLDERYLPIGAAAGSSSGCRETVPIGSFCGSFDMSGELTVSGSLSTGWSAGPSPEAAVTTG